MLSLLDQLVRRDGRAPRLGRYLRPAELRGHSGQAEDQWQRTRRPVNSWRQEACDVGLAGKTDGDQIISTVEEWEEETSTWKAADNLTLSRGLFGTVVLPRELLCPA